MRNKIGRAGFEIAKTPIGEIITGVAIGKFSRLLPIHRLTDNKHVIAFWHPSPVYKKHILIVPKKRIKNLSSLRENEMIYISEVFEVARELVTSQNFDKITQLS